jgi:hypothetical protein
VRLVDGLQNVSVRMDRVIVMYVLQLQLWLFVMCGGGCNEPKQVSAMLSNALLKVL